MKTQKSRLILFIILFNAIAHAQDLHFSQFNENPILINPALTGASSVVRASVTYKDQWRSITVPYKTYGVSIDMKFKASNWDKADKFKTRTYKKSFSRVAGGLAFYGDKAGDGNMGTTTGIVSLASFIPINKISSISLGLQGAIVQKKIDYSKLIFPDQFSGISYDPNLPSGQNSINTSFIYPDFSAGALWSYGYNEKAIGANNQFKANAGFSVSHVNQPKQKFLVDVNKKLYSKFNIHGNFLIGIPNSNVGIAPTFLFQFQGPSREFIGGFLIKYYIRDDSKYTGFIRRSSIGFGGYYRNKDAFIAALLLEFGTYAIGFSYDLNTSGLTKVSNMRGGPEISIRFNTPNPFLFQTNSKARFN